MMAVQERCERCRAYVYKTSRYKGRDLCGRCIKKSKGTGKKLLLAAWFFGG